MHIDVILKVKSWLADVLWYSKKEQIEALKTDPSWFEVQILFTKKFILTEQLMKN
jgi:hypothetical protein